MTDDEKAVRDAMLKKFSLQKELKSLTGEWDNRATITTLSRKIKEAKNAAGNTE